MVGDNKSVVIQPQESKDKNNFPHFQSRKI
jgi:hypothetical protein